MCRRKGRTVDGCRLVAKLVVSKVPGSTRSSNASASAARSPLQATTTSCPALIWARPGRCPACPGCGRQSAGRARVRARGAATGPGWPAGRYGNRGSPAPALRDRSGRDGTPSAAASRGRAPGYECRSASRHGRCIRDGRGRCGPGRTGRRAGRGSSRSRGSRRRRSGRRARGTTAPARSPHPPRPRTTGPRGDTPICPGASSDV